MTQLYARIFTQILDSSLAEDWQVRHVFEDLLKFSEDGVIDMTRAAIARRTNVPVEVINRAIAILEAPDPGSREAAEEGRRLARLDEHRDWGWRIVNWQKYEAIRNTEDQRAKTRERVRRHRERQRVSSALLPKADTEAEAEGNVVKRRKRYTTLPSVTPSQQWLAELAADPAYIGLDVQHEVDKASRWCKTNRKRLTRRFFVNWLNRADRPLQSDGQPPQNQI